jgi:hypothetical protein
VAHAYQALRGSQANALGIMTQRVLLFILVDAPVIDFTKSGFTGNTDKALMTVAALAVLADMLTLAARAWNVHAAIVTAFAEIFNTYLAIPFLGQ